MAFGPNGDPLQERLLDLGHELNSLQKGIPSLLEASQRHFPGPPPSHFIPRKVEGYVLGLAGYGRVSTVAILGQMGFLSIEIWALGKSGGSRAKKILQVTLTRETVESAKKGIDAALAMI